VRLGRAGGHRPIHALTLASVLFAAAAPLGLAADGVADPVVSEPHPSILIAGDAGFLSLVSGVRGGTGTPEDPFVISGWRILHTHAYGIRLLGTRAHVVIEDVWIDGAASHAGRFLDCAVAAPAEFCEGPQGIDLQDAQNVTIERTRVVVSTFGVRVTDSAQVSIRDLHLGAAVEPAFTQVQGVVIRRSQHVEVVQALVEGTEHPFWITDSTDVTVRSSTVWGLPSTMPLARSARVGFDANSIHHAGLIVSDEVLGLVLTGNGFRGGTALSATGPGTHLRGAIVCGNEFRTGAALDISHAENVVVVGNRLLETHIALILEASANVTFHRNLVSGNTGSLVAFLSNDDQEVHENAFVGNAGAIHITLGDATRNWWGDATGPSGDGPGTGDELRTNGGAAFAPWLTEPPDLAVDCSAL